MTDRPVIYITRGQVPDEFERLRRDWYIARHSTDVVGFGFLSARGFRAETEPQNVNIYELPSADLLTDPGYMAMRKADTFSPSVMGSFTYFSAALYAQDHVWDGAGAMLDKAPLFKGMAVSLLEFDIDPAAGTAPAWFERAVVRRWSGRPDVLTFRLWEQRFEHPLFKPKEARWCGAVEWSGPVDRVAVPLAEAAKDAPGLSRIRTQIAAKWYGLAREAGLIPKEL